MTTRPSIQSQIANRKSQIRVRGFSFVELMFAVVVLGIGFIMIAAVFPVGLQQVKTSVDETAAAANSRGMVAALTNLSQNFAQYTTTPPNAPANQNTYLFPATINPPMLAPGNGPGQVPLGTSVQIPGQLRSLRDPRVTYGRQNFLWDLASQQLINASDNRNAITVLYRRDMVATNATGATPVPMTPSPTVQLVVINAQATTHSQFTLDDVRITPVASAPKIYNLEPRPVAVKVQYYANEGIYTATFGSVKGIPGFANWTEYDSVPNAVAEGTFFVISDDGITGPLPTNSGRLNGRIYRVGVARPDIGAGVWQLSPGYSFSPDGGASGVLNDAAKDDVVTIGFDPTPKNSGSANPESPVAYDATNITFNPAYTTGAIAYILGRGFDNLTATPPGTPGNASIYTGPTQDIAVYTTFVNVP